MSEGKKMIELSKDEKEVCLKPASNLVFVANQLYNWINQGSYSEDVKGSLLDLSEQYIAELRRLL